MLIAIIIPLWGDNIKHYYVQNDAIEMAIDKSIGYAKDLYDWISQKYSFEEFYPDITVLFQRDNIYLFEISSFREKVSKDLKYKIYCRDGKKEYKSTS